MYRHAASLRISLSVHFHLSSKIVVVSQQREVYQEKVDGVDIICFSPKTGAVHDEMHKFRLNPIFDVSFIREFSRKFEIRTRKSRLCNLTSMNHLSGFNQL